MICENSSIEILGMHDCLLEDQFSYEFINAIKYSNSLQRVDLSKNKLNDVGEFQMEDFIMQNKNITELNLGECMIGD